MYICHCYLTIIWYYKNMNNWWVIKSLTWVIMLILFILYTLNPLECMYSTDSNRKQNNKFSSS